MVGDRKVIGFIPVRGGSKSIPLKNIKDLCGKPLVCWVIECLEQCALVDSTVVATDADIIEDVIASRHYNKISIYRRSQASATDTASTELVMLEYIQQVHLDQNSIFLLIQATSPLLRSIDLTKALEMYEKGGYDSLLSCVRNKRFFWTKEGRPINYDFNNRPRRQDFDGLLMENGAFYINTVGNIVKNKNRLCGNIGIYEMPEYTATEIDEENDWIVIENLMRRYFFT